ncbi:MAG: hypothetical protein RLZZ86_40 [Cyanobacteriota bacterium]|jgi:hypothetical protein
MSQLSKAGFETTYFDTAGTFADNTTRQITEGDMRQFADDIADSTLFLDDAYDNLQIVIDGGGSTITTGVKADLVVPYNCTVLGWDILANASGSIVVDVWKDTYANFPPTVADTITGTEKPTLSSAQKNQDTALTSWTTTLTRNDILRFNVDSATTVTRVTLSIRIRRNAA